MKKEITVSIADEIDTKKQTAKLSLHFEGQAKSIDLDVDGASLLKVSTVIPDLAEDFLCIASCIYAADKAVARKAEADKWTRHLAIEIPVRNVKIWDGVADALSDCIGFLTGDLWEISFRLGEKRLIQNDANSQNLPQKRPAANAVCLFSGGLDSFIGAVDWLIDNPHKQLLLVGHYDGNVSGPKSDQQKLDSICKTRFGDRYALAQTRIGLTSGSADTNFRSRSIVFIALGCYFAEVLGTGNPVLIPENGPIALNFPLTPARQGSCSTRTVHPHFIESLNLILARIGSHNPVHNPYKLKTKGEMVKECRDQRVLKNASALTRSCSKANRRTHWVNRKGPSGRSPLGCGICVPCLFRRASLHKRGLDVEVYGIPVESIENFIGDSRADLLALIAFLLSNYSDREIAAALLRNGTLSIDQLPAYVDLVKRMRSEMLVWLRAKGTAYLKSKIRAC